MLERLESGCWEEPRDSLFQCGSCSCFGISQQLFEFGPGLLDGVEAREVRWQLEDLSTDSGDALGNACDVMRTQVVYDNIAGLQPRVENVVQVGQEDLGFGSRLDSHGDEHAAEAHRAQDGEDLPVAFGGRFMNADASVLGLRLKKGAPRRRARHCGEPPAARRLPQPAALQRSRV